MKGSRTNTSYKHSHKIKHKSEAKYLTRTGTPDTIFSGKRHKRAVCLHKNTPKQHPFFSTQPWFDKGGCVPLKPPAFLCFKGVFPLEPRVIRGAAPPLNPRLFLGRKDTPAERVCLEAPLAEPSSPNPSFLFRLFRGAAPKDPVYKWGS